MIYAIHKVTKKHIKRPVMSEIGLAKDWDIVEADSDGWIPWAGDDEPPLPHGAAVEFTSASRHTQRCKSAPTLVWRHHGRPADIIAYRPSLSERSWVVDHMVSVISEYHSGNRSEAEAVCLALYDAGYRMHD